MTLPGSDHFTNHKDHHRRVIQRFCLRSEIWADRAGWITRTRVSYTPGSEADLRDLARTISTDVQASFLARFGTTRLVQRRGFGEPR